MERELIRALALMATLLLVLAGTAGCTDEGGDDGEDEGNDENGADGGDGGDGDDGDGDDGNATSETVLIVSSPNRTVNLTREELLALENTSGQGGKVTEAGGVEGPFDLIGVAVLDLLDLVGGMDAVDSLVAHSGGDNLMAYSLAQVSGEVVVYDQNGIPTGFGGMEMLLAYGVPGVPVPNPPVLQVGFISGDSQSDLYTAEELWMGGVVELEVGPEPEPM